MNGYELSLAITALANTISCNLCDKELELLAAAATQLGDTLNTILAQRELYCIGS